MKIWSPAITAVLALFFSSMASAASGKVSYQCLNNKRVSVNYSFNSAGIPVQAVVNLKGKQRILRYNKDRSDDVDTFFEDKNGYSLGTSYMDTSNYHDTSIMIMSPGSEILFKDCLPSVVQSEDKPRVQDASKITKHGSAYYMCGKGRSLKINYGFNGTGVPVQAEVVLDGKKRTLLYDLNRSNDVESFFKDQRGYNLGTSYIDADNFRDASVIVTAPDNEILYKNCSPTVR